MFRGRNKKLYQGILIATGVLVFVPSVYQMISEKIGNVVNVGALEE